MIKIVKRSFLVLLSFALLVLLSAYLPRSNKLVLSADEVDVFTNEYDFYPDANYGEDVNLSSEVFVSIDDLYEIVRAVSVNDNYYGFLELPFNEINNNSINDFIELAYYDYHPQSGDWITALNNNNEEVRFSYENGNWINKGVFTLDETIEAQIETLVGAKSVKITTADDLYKLGNMASINFDKQGKINSYIFEKTIKKILSLDYFLLSDIDYSTKRAQKFIPLGININIDTEGNGDNINYYFPFTGSFNGNGFTIKNLYLADYSYLSTTFQDADASTAITASLFAHYAMFSANEGVIKNFVLENPRYDLIIGEELAGFLGAAMLVGLNKGTIYNVAVIDQKKQVNEDISGMTVRVPLISLDMFKAAGFVYQNGVGGKIYNSFLISNKVLNDNSTKDRFTQIEAFYLINDGSLEGVSYLTNITNSLKEAINTNDDDVKSYSESAYKEGSNVNINEFPLTSERFSEWHFYPADGFPSLHSLNYLNGYYEINDELDFIIFSRLIKMITEKEGKSFDKHTYKLTNDLDFINFDNFSPIEKQFSGVLTSINEGDPQFITRLKIAKPYLVGSNYYLALFSELSGTVKNINFLNNEITVTDSDSHYGKTFYVGMIAGRLKGGTIENVLSNANIDLGSSSLGLTYVGGLVGFGNGKFQDVGLITKNGYGEIKENIHNFNNRNIIAKFHVGGVIGANDGKIIINNSFNEMDLYGVSSNDTNYQTNGLVETFTGGIIGLLNNFTASDNSLTYLTNVGTINSGLIKGKAGNKAHHYSGGIFGNLKGYGFKLNSGDLVYNGRFENRGLLKGAYLDNNSYLYLAGIGVVSTDKENAEVSYLVNKAGFEINYFGYQNHNKYIYYASTVIDNTVSSGLTLSRAYNTFDYQVGSSYFNNSNGEVPNEIALAFFFSSVNDVYNILKYVVNYGSLTVGSSGSDINVAVKLKVSNITQATRIDYYNVTNSGDVSVLRIKNTSDSIYVAGVAWILAFDNRAYQMNNVVNEGDIITAGIKGDTEVSGTVTGPSFSHSTFKATLFVRNLYVAGIVNLNVGEIINAFNLGKITSTYNSNVRDINGTANTFVGGINTFNYNLIKDAANSGLIEYTNSSTYSVSHFAATTNVSTINNSTFGGISIAYTGGLVLGGIVGALGDISGTELEGHKEGAVGIVAEVIDTANNGDVYGKAKEYVRSGGILGVALSVELASGTFSNDSSTVIAGPFTTAIVGEEDPAGESLLSNGLNFGNIYAVTANVGSYGDDTARPTRQVAVGNASGNNVANAMRPGINASAGGVIAYGLTKMVRMLNHGVISSTDVAGGIVGATYILGGTSTYTPVTWVEINTAVHYGRIKAIKIGAYNNNRVFITDNKYNEFYYKSDENFDDLNRYYGIDEYDQYILYRGNASASYLIETYQQARRGFGGIFGRLQRGNYGAMRSTTFKNIMNMDETIDMVGRVDSNLPGSLKFYRFFTGEETYYTAKEKDTTPNAFAGWTYSSSVRYNYQNARVRFTVRRSFSTYYVTDIEVLSPNTVTEVKTVSKVIMRENGNDITNTSITYNTPNYLGFTLQNNTNTGTNYRVAAFGLTAADYGSININATKTFIKENYTYYPNLASSSSNGSSTTPPTAEALRYPIRTITDDPNISGKLNIFDENFSLMQPENAEYIYAVEEDALASRFRTGGENEKPHGMYVLASSTGSRDGATLPTNIKVTDLFKLNESEYKYLNLDQVSLEDKIVPAENDEDEIVYKYQSMYQLSYNNKSEVLTDEETSGSSEIAELILYDPNGESPILRNGIIDYNNNEITYEVSTSAFSSNSFHYQVLYNELSQGAIIAKSNLDNDEYNILKNDYGNRVNEILPFDSDVKWEVSGTVASGNTAEFTMRVYSEIYVKDQNIRDLDKYYTDYTIKLIRSGTPLNMNATINLNNTDSTHDQIGDAVTITDRNMPPAGTISAIFTGYGSNDTNRNAMNALIPLGHEMAVFGLYFDSINEDNKIAEEFYQLEIIPKGSRTDGNEFGFSLTLSDELKAGDYIISYGYYETSSSKTIAFTKDESIFATILNLDYDYYSSDLAGTDFSFTPQDTDFITFLEFGYQFSNVTTTNQSLSVDANNYSDPYHYQNEINSYTLSLGGKVIVDDFKISPFAELTEAEIRYQFTEEGKREYFITYTISPESGTSKTITQTIRERDLTNIDVFLNDNLQTSTSFSILREALTSKVDVDFNFIDNTLYEEVFMVDVVNDEEKLYLLEDDNSFSFVLTNLLETGEKDYHFKLIREGNEYDLVTLKITKELGVSAYLVDVKFEGLEGGAIFKYPLIRASDQNGNPNDSYDTRFYAEGIDYLDSEGDVFNFRIDGEVSDIDLEHYSPGFVLPLGAKIRRYDNINGWTAYTSDVNDDILKTNYVGLFDELEIIKYEVISEDGNNTVSYFLTAKDVKYNLTLRFKIYYRHPTLGLIDANSDNSPIKNNVLVISLINMELDDDYQTTGSNNKVSEFPQLEEENFVGLNNQSSLYYFIEHDKEINFRFGRNMTGAYNFNVVTPKYRGAETENLSPKERYTYDMYIIPRGTSEESWYDDEYQLPEMETYIESYQGKFYYVYFPSTNPITRELAIVINPETVDKKWGLYDDFTTFD